MFRFGVRDVGFGGIKAYEFQLKTEEVREPTEELARELAEGVGGGGQWLLHTSI